MSRIRSFEVPHKALRNVIAKVSFRLGSVDVSDPLQLQALKQTAEEMFTLLHNHVHTENEHTLTHLEARAPGSGDHDRADHERLELIQDDLQDRIKHLDGNTNPDALHVLYLDFSRYHSQYLEHIFEEETVTEVLLHKHFTDEELMQHRQTIMGRMEFPILLLWLKYAIPAQRVDQNAGMLSGFKANAPSEAYEQVLKVIRNEMDSDPYAQLLSRIS
jgi:hypothetical protein